MPALDLPTEPYWLDLPRGVRVEIRPVTTAVMAAAQAAAARRLAAIRLAEPDLEPTSLFQVRTGLTAGQTRWYWLRGVSAEGNVSAFAGPVTATVP